MTSAGEEGGFANATYQNYTYHAYHIYLHEPEHLFHKGSLDPALLQYKANYPPAWNPVQLKG
jgi:hypothetical protein